MSAHTPGPCPGHPLDNHTCVACERDRLRDVNAEMLAALKAISEHTSNPHILLLARSAIARAGGR